MKRLLLLSALLIIISGCAHTKVVRVDNIPLMKAIEPVKVEEADPYKFERSMPSSSMTLNSLISFSKTYPRVYSDDGVLSMGAGSDMLAVLKENEIGFTMPLCSGLVLKKRFYHIRVYGYEAAVFNEERIEVYSARECAMYGSYQRLLRGGVEIIPGHILEWEGSRAVLRNSYNGKVLFNGDTGIPILSAGMIDGRPALLQNTGYLLLYNQEMKSFTLLNQLPSGYDKIFHSEGSFYGTLLKNGKFFIMDAKDAIVSDEENCEASAFGLAGRCGSKLLAGKKIYRDLPDGQFFTANKKSYATLNEEGNFNIYYLDVVWQRFLSMNYTIPKACVSEGALYFKSFSGNTYKIHKGKESKVSSIPENCRYTGVYIKNGDFYCGGRKPCAVFSKIVNKDKNTQMMRRIENNTIYYYFEKIKK